MKSILAVFLTFAFIAASAPVGAAETAADAKVQTHCPVSGEKLGSMGKSVKVKHGGRTVRLCCKPCVKKFKADPEKYLKKVE